MSRKFVSLTILFSFLILFFSSFVLYVIPGGGTVAPGWSFLALSRSRWTDLHIAMGLLFLVFGLCHVVMNRRGLATGLGKAASIGRKSFWPLAAALALNLFVAAGALNHLPPVEGALTIHKQAKERFRTGYVGNPPRKINLENFGVSGAVGDPERAAGRAAAALLVKGPK